MSGTDAAIYWVPVPGGRGIISLWIPRAVSGWRKKQIKECEMSLKQMQILDGAEAVKPEPVIDKSAAIRIATSLGWTPQRKPLTDEEIQTVHDNVPDDYTEDSWVHSFARAIEAAHGIKE